MKKTINDFFDSAIRAETILHLGTMCMDDSWPDIASESFEDYPDEVWAALGVAEPVNARLLSTLIQCRDRFAFYVGHHLDKGDMGKAAEDEKFVALANDAISAAEAQQERLLQDMHDAGGEIDRVMAESAPDAEGWTPDHDDAHKAGSLGRAGGFYALNAGAAMWYGTHDTSICDTAPDGWPWEPEWWKPVNARRDLVKAAALILAEIERMDREAAKLQPPKSED